MIPMYQRPTLLAWDSVIQGPASHPRWRPSGTSLTGAEGGQLRANACRSMNVMEPDGNEIESIYIANAILEGAFTITPDLEYAPFWSRRGADCQRRLSSLGPAAARLRRR